MKNCLKKIKHLLFICTFLFITSCSKDNYEESIAKGNNTMKIEVLNSKAIKKEKALSSTINKLNLKLSQLNSLKKNVTSGVYNFSIDTDYCKMITLDSVTSYTFSITREPSNEDFENIVIKRLPNGELISKLYKYNVTPEEKHNILHGIDVDMTNKIEVADIDDTEFTSSIFQKALLCYQAEMVMSSGTPCKGEEHHAYGDTTCPFINSPYMQAQAPTLSVVYVPIDCGGGAGGTYYGPNGQPYPGYPPGVLDTGVITTPVPQISFEEEQFKIFKKNLTQAQQDWLTQQNQQNENVDASIFDFLNNNEFDSESVNFINSVINMLMNEPNIDNNALQFMLNAQTNNMFNNDIDEAFIINNAQLFNSPAQDPIIAQQLMVYFSIKCAILRHNNPSWSNVKIYWEASKDLIHLSLDIFGLVPIVGEAADLVNGILYTIEGEGVNATLSFASAVPILGWWTTGTKLGIKVVSTTTGSTKLIWKMNSGIISFGQRGQLRKVLGLLPGNSDQAHHIISWAQNIASHNIVQKAAKSANAFHLNNALNGIAVAAWRNQPNHNIYNNRIMARLNALPTNLTPDQAYAALSNLVSEIRTKIINNPNSHLNDIIF